MARIEAIEGGNNIRVSKGYKPSIEETKSKIRESIVLRRQGSMNLPVLLRSREKVKSSFWHGPIHGSKY